MKGAERENATGGGELTVLSRIKLHQQAILDLVHEGMASQPSQPAAAKEKEPVPASSTSNPPNTAQQTLVAELSKPTFWMEMDILSDHAFFAAIHKFVKDDGAEWAVQDWTSDAGKMHKLTEMMVRRTEEFLAVHVVVAITHRLIHEGHGADPLPPLWYRGRAGAGLLHFRWAIQRLGFNVMEGHELESLHSLMADRNAPRCLIRAAF